MANFSADCPHCLTIKAGFASSAHVAASGRTYHIPAVCGVCQKAVIAVWLHTGPNTANTNVLTANTWRLAEMWPRALPSQMPEHLPTNVQAPYRQAEASLRAGHWDAAGSMFRKALDIATKNLGADRTKVLAARIDQLAVNYAITPDLKAWAHNIRLEGNDAVHEDDPFTEDQATDLEFFTRLFLTYTFTLPEMLRERTQGPASA